MNHLTPVTGVYHTHYDEDQDMWAWAQANGIWPTRQEWREIRDEADARDSATSTLYTDVLGTEASDVLMCASTARAQVRFELDAYLDDEPVACSRTYKLRRMRKHNVYGHMAKHRDEKRYRGGRQRGAWQYDVAMQGHVMPIWNPLTEAHDTWKNHRRYQEHGRS